MMENIMNTNKNPFMPDHEIPLGPIGPNPYVPGKIMIKPVEFVNTKAAQDMGNPFMPNFMPKPEVK